MQTGAIVVGATALVAVAFELHRLTRLLADRPAGSPPRSPPTAAPTLRATSSATTPPPVGSETAQRPTSPDRARRVTSDIFLRAWSKGPFEKQARRECWDRIAEKTGRDDLSTSLHFFIKVRPDGTVAGVEPDILVLPDAPAQPDQLYTCVAKVIRGMRFSPGEREVVTRVQANRLTRW